MTWREFVSQPGAPVALALAVDVGAAVAVAGRDPVTMPADQAPADLAALQRESNPRWVWWSRDTAVALRAFGVEPQRCWDLTATHRLIHGGWKSGPDRIWAGAHGLDATEIPTEAPVDLFTHSLDTGDPDEPVRPDGHLRPDWVAGGWSESLDRLARWAALAIRVQTVHADRIDAPVDPPARLDDAAHRRTTAHSESAAELLCADLERDGLPVDRATAEAIVAAFVGPRPTNVRHEEEILDGRDDEVLRHLPAGTRFDLRSPDQVRSLLRRVGIEVPDTRAWRLERLVDAHPIVAPLLAWRRAERIRTTFGYGWIDEHVGADGRLRGSWSGTDGAAGRMTATAGLHNMPAELRPAVVAEDGHVLVRADLGQIEPRVLAAVSGDDALAAATHADDMYAPVAERLRVARDVAKVAVLGAMYGQTTGRGAEALAGLTREYPVAMGHLQAADDAGQGGRDLRTYGGRRVAMSDATDPATVETVVRARAAARGRYGRNAIVQGAAAEFFKTWAVLVRRRSADVGASIVLCLHDELLVHAPETHGAAVARLVDDCLAEAAHRWSPRTTGPPVRFVADTTVIRRWSEAK